MKLLRILEFLLALAGFAGPGVIHAQSNPPFQNPSLDSNCYFPQIGVPGEIDTIYGSAHDTIAGVIYGNRLGEYIHNLGPKPDGSLGKMLIGMVDSSALAPTGPSFNLHNLHAIAQNLGIDPQNTRYGHFHDRSHLDIFDQHLWRIYWADDNGNYDSSRYTDLKRNVGVSLPGDFTPPYVAHLTSDTVDDIVGGFETHDSMYLALFTGGERLFAGQVAYEDTSLVMPPPYLKDYHYTLQGDFRGMGREDLLITDYQDYNDLFYYKNDPPFTLAKLLHAMRYDTIWPQSPFGWRIATYTSLVMPALPKKKTDSSCDLLAWTPLGASGIYFFRGGPDFGSHRITIDSAAYVITKPELGETNWPDFINDAGDMTNTGNHVLYVAADDGRFAYQNFYLTGQALDNKIDIYNSFAAGALIDTVTANSDSFEDVLMGFPGYTTDNDHFNGKTNIGSMWVMYGSKQIPVRLNPQFADVKDIPQKDGAGITFTPNPVTRGWSVATIVWPEAENAKYSIYDMLGRECEHGLIHLLGEAEQQRIYFPGAGGGSVYLFHRRRPARGECTNSEAWQSGRLRHNTAKLYSIAQECSGWVGSLE